MCGIIVSNCGLEFKNLHHRGPDNFTSLKRGGWYFDHFRLSIRDLSEEANQPYSKLDAKEILVYNGEIYNAEELTVKYLEGVDLHTSSDTEVLYEILRKYGVSILQEVDGMFAFVFYDGEKVIASRDRMGIKPLFVGAVESKLVFSSELSIILENLHPTVNEELIPEFIKYKYVGPQSTIYKGIRRLEPGSYEIFNTTGLITKQKFWDLADFDSVASYCENDRVHLNNIIQKSISGQLVSDVPVGVQLSGGIDSTIIRENVPNSYESYSSVFENNYSHDERKFIEICTTKNKSIVNWITFSEDYFRNNITNLFKNSGGVNHPHTLAIQQIAAEANSKVKVLLSGEGADELFIGYERYRKINEPMDIITSPEFYSDMEIKEYFNITEEDVISSKNSRLKICEEFKDRTLLNRLRILEIRFHLQNLLERYDKASMKHSIEGRVPLLSNAMIDFALQKDAASFIQNDTLKTPLKDILKANYADDFVYREKIGYRVPINEWLFTTWFFELICDCLDNKYVVKYMKKTVLQDIRANNITDKNLLGKLYWTILNLSCL